MLGIWPPPPPHVPDDNDDDEGGADVEEFNMYVWVVQGYIWI